nr:hypothetical protein [uncultured Cohaesibacter sp.]
MISRFSNPISVASLLLFALVLMLAGITKGEAASDEATCKPLNQAQCVAASKCAWVKSYESKNGTKVRAHCRAKNKTKSSVLNRLFNSTKSSTTITKLTSKKKVDVKRNKKPSEK